MFRKIWLPPRRFHRFKCLDRTESGKKQEQNLCRYSQARVGCSLALHLLWLVKPQLHRLPPSPSPQSVNFSKQGAPDARPGASCCTIRLYFSELRLLYHKIETVLFFCFICLICVEIIIKHTLAQ